ncbi:TPA: HAD family hydrolase [Candidatus Bathyarchaeota archaeon]|nr:HAD family hydrolase [Candidatus Bathyarchaeota archaeon]
MTHVEAVLFDLGGTLIKTACIPKIIKKILSLYGIERSLSEIECAYRKAESKVTLKDYRLPYMKFWAKWNKMILLELNVTRNIEVLSRLIVELWWDHADVKLYPDVEETIRQLKEKKIKMGIVTNGFKKDVDEVLKRVRLPKVFDAIVGVDSVAKPKPHKEIFLIAVKKLAVKPFQTLFIGDSIEMDYIGATEAGLNALLIDRGNYVQRSDIARIRHLTEVINYI